MSSNIFYQIDGVEIPRERIQKAKKEIELIAFGLGGSLSEDPRIVSLALKELKEETDPAIYKVMIRELTRYVEGDVLYYAEEEVS